MQSTGPIARRLTTWLLLGAALSWVQAQDLDQLRSDPGSVSLPKGIEIQCEATLKQTEDSYACTGPVSIRWQSTRLQADSLSLRDGRYIEAEGNVLIVWGGNRIFGSRISYDIETERGIIEDAMGSVLNEYLIWAKSVEKIGEKTIKVKKAVVTTCTQPQPYWSFRVSRAIITIDKYAHMYNVRFRASKVPFLYLPYLVWPIKPDRAAGLLFPDFGTSQARGWFYTQQLFVPLGRSADVTLLGRYFQRAGFGGGGTVRFIPNKDGQGEFRGFAIDDKVYAATLGNGDGFRYGLTYQQRQSFRNGFRMVADINEISDPNYYADYANNLNLASSPDTLAQLEFSRNGAWVSMNVRERRREQLSTGLVQQSLPEIEFRGRSKRLGKSPFYLSFESSFASIQQSGSTIDANYLRGDVFPQLSLPFSPTPWIDITPRVSYRLSYWTQQQRLDLQDSSRTVLDSAIKRGLVAYGIDTIGPKIYRIYDSPRARYKHSLEPQVRYGFAQSFNRDLDIIFYDEVDVAQGFDQQVSYALVQRLFASRPQANPSAIEEGPGSIMLPDGSIVEELPEAAEERQRESQFQEPLDIASLQISQARSFDQDLSRADTDGDGIIDATSPYSPILLNGRYNPDPRTSLDLRATWNILFRQFSELSVSGAHRRGLYTLRGSLFHRQGLGATASGLARESDTQVRYFSGFNLLRDASGQAKLQFSLAGSYVANPGSGTSHFPQQSWQFRYATQCCTIFVERLTRDIDDRRELSFRVDLTGVGKIFSSTF